jgi:HEAT repeat protein/beta-lactamase regulating signal transducer with metallopeptidase domain
MTGAWLVTTLIKVTALLVTVALAAAVLRRASASLRHLLWTAGIVGVLVLPLLTLTVPWRLAVLPAVTRGPVFPAAAANAARQPGGVEDGVPQGAGTATHTAVRQGDPATEPAAAPASVEPAGPALSARTALFALWATVAGLLLARLFLGSWILARAVRRAAPLTTRDWTRPLLEAADRLGLAKLPRLVVSNRLPMPYACGLLRPTIVLPAGAETWTDRQRRVVLCHELAHVHRFDLALNALGQVACALWWFHPLVWIAARNLRTESERACDDLVLGLGTRASEYADHLLSIVSRAARARTPAIALPMAQRHEFEGRMLAILERDARRNPTSRRQSAAVLAMAVVVLVPLVAAAPTDTTVPTVPTDTMVRPDTAVAKVPTVTTDTTARRDTAATAVSRMTEPADARGEQARADGAAGTVETLAPQDSSRVVRALLNTLMHDSVASVRKNAAYALGHMGAVAAVMPLSERVDHDASPAVREMAGWALGQIGSTEATKALSAAALQDSTDYVRAIAVWALGHLDDPAAVTPLASVVANDSSAEVRARAAWALGTFGALPAPPSLMAALRDAEPQVRLTAAWALGQIGDDVAAPALGAALEDQDAQVRKAVLWALGRMDGDLAQTAMLKALQDPDPEVRAQAAQALGGGHVDPWPWPWPMPLFGGHDDAWAPSGGD